MRKSRNWKTLSIQRDKDRITADFPFKKKMQARKEQNEKFNMQAGKPGKPVIVIQSNSKD